MNKKQEFYNKLMNGNAITNDIEGVFTSMSDFMSFIDTYTHNQTFNFQLIVYGLRCAFDDTLYDLIENSITHENIRKLLEDEILNIMKKYNIKPKIEDFGTYNRKIPNTMLIYLTKCDTQSLQTYVKNIVEDGLDGFNWNHDILLFLLKSHKDLIYSITKSYVEDSINTIMNGGVVHSYDFLKDNITDIIGRETNDSDKKILTDYKTLIDQTEEELDFVYNDYIEGYVSDGFDNYERDYHEEYDDSGDNRDLSTHEIIMSLNKSEMQNRLKKVLYKGEPRVKGKIYSDTIQQQIFNVEKGTRQYELVDGIKKLKPISQKVTRTLDFLKKILSMSKTNGYIYVVKDNDIMAYETDDTPDDIGYLTLSKNIIKYAKYKSFITSSDYIGSTLQTLISDTEYHYLFHVYIDNTDEIIDLTDDDNLKQLLIKYRDFTVHQRLNNNKIQLGFVRYHNIDDMVWVNTIQSDISYGMRSKKSGASDDELNRLYETCIKITFDKFIGAMNKKGVEQIVVPSSNTRHMLFGNVYEDEDLDDKIQHNAGYTYAYNDLPNLFGFKRVKMVDTIWSELSNESRSKLKDLNVYVRGDLNESKTPSKNLTINEILDVIINRKNASQISNKDKIRLDVINKFHNKI